MAQVNALAAHTALGLSGASSHEPLSRGAALPPQRRHHRANSSVSTTRQASTARPGSSRWPATYRPSSSSRQNEPRSGRTKVKACAHRPSGAWAGAVIAYRAD